MMKEIKGNEIIGKTIAGYYLSNISTQAVITFTDGTFVTLDISFGFEKGDETIFFSRLNFANFENSKLIELGVITQTESDQLAKERQEKMERIKDKRDREIYERLKLKFKEQG